MEEKKTHYIIHLHTENEWQQPYGMWFYLWMITSPSKPNMDGNDENTGWINKS
jgi:hypothetical protein